MPESIKNGKRLATELKKLKVDFVSLVGSGANGQRFEVFKSADYKPEDIENDSEVISEEVKNLVQSMKDGLSKFLALFPNKKSKKTNQELSVSDKTEILEAITGLAGQVKGLTDRVESFEKSKDGETDAEKTARESAEKKAADDKATAEKKAADDKAKETGGSDAGDDKANKEILAAVKAVGETVNGLENRVKTIEETRQTSNAMTPTGIPAKKTVGEGEEVDESADFFKGMLGGDGVDDLIKELESEEEA